MRVGVLSYPMLYQRTGGLQIQINESIAGLRELGVDVTLVDPSRVSLSQFDIIHVFAAINGNHRIVETARSLGCKVVLSPLIRPSWTRFTGWRSAMIERLVGRLTNWHVHTIYQELKVALDESHKIIALGVTEKESIQAAFDIPADKVCVIPNGIPQRFFDATPDLFRERFAIDGPCILNVAAINPHKNQLALVKATAGTGYTVMLFGECLKEHEDYLAALTAYPHVRYGGRIAYQDPILPSAYAAATAFALPSHDEVMPLSVMEALAAGTPVVMTDRHAMGMKPSSMVKECGPDDVDALRRLLIDTVTAVRAPLACKEVVTQYRWRHVAESILRVYEEVLPQGKGVKVVAEVGEMVGSVA
ncbi:glycosyltransferase family 4 protein [Noviherbaspirillum galbum]|uniref:Glycosyltransferase family 4 protein n=1 Tax=Noviherbaspirillum galbum TaxID=2709383 RepID=A0A6B3ST39_9BURK|nr:glycosyltransferase family 4 protein [Noviherbaspirillum galbum]NEX64140.1 glycosyltransferase family 4 protein [Noviherbaspirillum galbum]